MGSVYINTINELQKIFLRKKNRVLLLLTALIPVAAAFSFSFLQTRLGIFAVSSASFPLFMLGVFSSFILPLFIFSVAADLFAGEVGEKTLKITLTWPITRLNLFISKNIAMGTFIIANLGIVFSLTAILGLFLEGSAQAYPLFQALLAYLTAFIPLFFLSVLAVFLNQFFKNSGGALTTSILVYLSAKALPLLFPTLAKVSPFAYTDWHLMWLGSSVGAGKLLNIFLLFVAYILILFAAGFYLFDKKDF